MNSAVSKLSALAQEHRLAVFRLLVQAGPEGMNAGAIAASLGIAPNTLTFHCDRLRAANLITVQRHGRSMVYAACFDQMAAVIDYLTENCCGGEACAPIPARAPARKRKSA